MVFVGIDWSEQILDFQMRNTQGEILVQGQANLSAEGLAEMFLKWEAQALPGEINIAIETAHGAWVQALLDRGYRVYPVNPKSVDSFRKALSANGDKTDQIDRKVLALFLRTFHQDLKPLQPDAPEIIVLRVLCQDRLRLLEERTAKLNELKSVLKCHYPAFLGLFGGLESQIALQFLEEFPTQNQMLALKEHGVI